MQVSNHSEKKASLLEQIDIVELQVSTCEDRKERARLQLILDELIAEKLQMEENEDIPSFSSLVGRTIAYPGQTKQDVWLSYGQEKGKERVSDESSCYYCGSKEVILQERVSRSAEEEDTELVICKTCGKIGKKEEKGGPIEKLTPRRYYVKLYINLLTPEGEKMQDWLLYLGTKGGVHTFIDTKRNLRKLHCPCLFFKQYRSPCTREEKRIADESRYIEHEASDEHLWKMPPSGVTHGQYKLSDLKVNTYYVRKIPKRGEWEQDFMLYNRREGKRHILVDLRGEEHEVEDGDLALWQARLPIYDAEINLVKTCAKVINFLNHVEPGRYFVRSIDDGGQFMFFAESKGDKHYLIGLDGVTRTCDSFGLWEIREAINEKERALCRSHKNPPSTEVWEDVISDNLLGKVVRAKGTSCWYKFCKEEDYFLLDAEGNKVRDVYKVLHVFDRSATQVRNVLVSDPTIWH